VNFSLFYNIFRLIFVIIFVGLHFSLMFGILLEYRRDRRSHKMPFHNFLPKVSVLIPVHNEEKNLERLFHSLSLQDYPNTEIIFIDDRSTDKSAEMLSDAVSLFKKNVNVKILTIHENPGPNYKQYALRKGIEIAQGDFFLFTDADCEVSPRWIFAMVERMYDEKVGIVIGPVFKKLGKEGFFHLYQCFDHAVRYMYLVGSTGIGSAGGGFGNNLILRKTTLEIIGGYEKIPPSPTEDAALISQIRSSSNYKIRSAVGSDLFVMTNGEYSWKDLINQTLRWNNGGLFSPDFATRFNFRFLMITISMGIIAIPLLFFIPSLWTFTFAVMFSMSMNTIATLKLFASALPKKRFAYILQVVFTPMYFTFLTILGFCRFKFKWKGKEVNSSCQPN